LSIFLLFFRFFSPAQAAYHFANFKGRPPIHQFGGVSARRLACPPIK
jgi:hypothetical protein